MSDDNAEELIPSDQEATQAQDSKYPKAVNFLPEKFKEINFSVDSFLFIAKPNPDTIDKECLFGLSLKTGVRIFAIIMLFESLSAFMDVLSPETLWKLIFHIIIFLFYLITGFYAFYSTIKEKKCYAKISYFLIALVFIIDAVRYICKSLLKLIEFITPWDSDFLRIKFLIYIFGYGFYLFIYLYLVWILFCYMKSLPDDEQDNKDKNETEILMQ